MSLQLGQIIDGKYRIVRLIGEGGMGAVFEGENTRIRRKVAIKLLHSGIASNAEMVQRFEREAQVAGTVGNDHILEILDLGALPNGDRYMVMEYLEGETLTERIKARSRLQARDALSVVKQMLAGLEAAHAAGIVHRDLKPDNIFILRSKAGVKDFVKIIDFGISKFQEQGASSRMTRTGALMGTPHYMAPEQATGSAEIDRRTDIYAVGIILYEAVTGRVPFQAETFNQLLFEIALAKITPARQIVPDLDPAVDSLIMKASARDPAHRFQTCAEFIEAITNFEQTGGAVSLPPEQSIEAIVAATVPRTGSMRSAAPSEPTLSASQPGRLSTGSMPTPPTTPSPVQSAPPAQPTQPTLNSWANSQAGLAAKKGPPVLAATIIGVLLLLGGGALAFVLMKPAPAAVSPSASAPPSASAVPVIVKEEAAPPLPAEPSSVPAVSAASAEPDPSGSKAVAALGASKVGAKTLAHTPSPPAHVTAPPPAEKPKSKAINFGY